MPKAQFQALLQEQIETASNRLLEQGRAELASIGLGHLAPAPDKSRQ